jgi:adenylate kinase
MQKQAIILFGAPGAGKGTQSGLLSDRMGLYNFETSRILEKNFKEAENLSEDSDKRFIEIEGEKFDTFKEIENWKTGILCSPPYVAYLVMAEIKKLFKEGNSLVFSGSPRTIYEVERVMPLLVELYEKENIKIVLIEVDPEETIFRNSHRKICELMRHSILFDKETENLTICPLDGSKLLKREGLDNPETIKIRLKEYSERTLPMLEYFANNCYDVKKINGSQSVSAVFNDIINAIK